MTINQKSFSLIILLTLPLIAFSQTPGKTFSKSFNTDEKGIVRLDLPGALEVKEWDNPSIRIEINVSLSSGNNALLKELANVGRYNLVAKSIDLEDVLSISAPNLQKQVKVKGEILRESITFLVYVPKNIKVETPKTDILALAKK